MHVKASGSFPWLQQARYLASTVGSFVTGPLTLAVGQDPTLLIFGAACLGTAIFLGRTGYSLLGATNPMRAGHKGAVRTVPLTEVPGLMREYPIVRYLIITGLIPNILLPIFFYQFSIIANNTFTSEQSLISFLSLFRGMTTMTTFVLLFFMGRLYSSVGLTNSSLVQPFNFAVLFGSLTGFFNIYVACYGQFTTLLIQRAIAGPVNKILYSIIPSDLMAWSRTFLRGTVLKVGMLSGSLLMIALKPVVSAQYLSVIAFVLTMYWSVESLIFRRHYKRILKQVIVEKQIDFEQIESVQAFDSGGAAMQLDPVSMESRFEEFPAPDSKTVPRIDPEIALKLLDDENPGTRADAAASFAQSQDIRAVSKLIRCLEDKDDDVRKAAIEALMSYRDTIVPYLEISLIDTSLRAKQGILEVMRLAEIKDFELIPFLGKQLAQAYGNLIAVRRLQDWNGNQSAGMLSRHLLEVNEEILSLIFYALWVYHADMRLMYQALKSETASIAVELVENSIQKELTPYLIPLIEDIPLDEKIEKGRMLFPLIRNDTPERLLTFLANAEDPITRMLALFVIGDQMPHRSFVPIVEARLEDKSPYVREIAEYAWREA